MKKNYVTPTCNVTLLLECPILTSGEIFGEQSIPFGFEFVGGDIF